MTQERLRFSLEGALARITFCAPERKNAIDLAFLEAFAVAALDAATTPAARAILIEAEGPAFSVGAISRKCAASATAPSATCWR